MEILPRSDLKYAIFSYKTTFDHTKFCIIIDIDDRLQIAQSSNRLALTLSMQNQLSSISSISYFVLCNFWLEIVAKQYAPRSVG